MQLSSMVHRPARLPYLQPRKAQLNFSAIHESATGTISFLKRSAHLTQYGTAPISTTKPPRANSQFPIFLRAPRAIIGVPAHSNLPYS